MKSELKDGYIQFYPETKQEKEVLLLMDLALASHKVVFGSCHCNKNIVSLSLPAMTKNDLSKLKVDNKSN